MSANALIKVDCSDLRELIPVLQQYRQVSRKSWEDILQQVLPVGPLLIDPRAPLQLVDPTLNPVFVNIGQRSAFKTSTGVEVRFFMPVLNVPFRLIFYYDPQRGGVLDNSLQPQSAYGFRFALGSTF